MLKARFFRHLAPWRTWLPTLVTGFLAGAVNGLLGTGGGIIVVLALGATSRINQGTLVSPPVDEATGSAATLALRSSSPSPGKRDILATSLTAMLPISVLSALRYAERGALELSSFAPLLIPSLVGGVIGGIFLDRLRLPLVQKLFALLLIFSGVRMLLR